MVTARTARHVLHAVADALPEHGNDVLTGLEIRDTWGDAVLVRLHTSHERSPAALALTGKLRTAAEEALDGRRHRVEIAWGSLGTGL